MSQITDNSQILTLLNQVTTRGVILDLSEIDIISLSSTYTVETQSPATVASADISGDVFESVGHGLVTGVVGQMTTDDTLPSPLMVLTNYYIITIDADHFSLAASLGDALTGVAITLADAGTGNQTFTPTTASGTLALYESVDGQTFVAVSGVTVTITMSGTTIWHVDPVFSRYYKVLFTAMSGVISIGTTMNARNNTAWSNANVVPTSAVNS